MGYLVEGFKEAFRLLTTLDPVTVSAVTATLKVSSSSILVSLLLGVPCGFVLGCFQVPGKKGIRAMVDTLLAFPTVVIGLLVYMLLSRQGPLGSLELLYTLPGIAVGQAILGLPVVVSLTATAMEGLDSRLVTTLRTLGARPRHILLTSLWEARFAVMAAGVVAYGRIVSEVGISMMVGGNIKWHTRTITTAIALETAKGDFAMGLALGIVLLGIALTLNALLILARRRT